MFLLLVRILLWIIIGLGIYLLLVKIIPKQLLVLLGGSIIFLAILITFIDPSAQIAPPLWTILSLPFKPVGLSILLILLGVIRIKKGVISKPGPTLIWIGLVIILLSSTPFLAYQMAQGMESEAIETEQKRQLCTNCNLTNLGVEPVPAIILLGQGTTEAFLPNRPKIQLTDRGDRILYTVDLYKQQILLGADPLVIISAGLRSDLDGTAEQRSEARDIATLLQEFGIPATKIIQETKSRTLRSSAESIKKILDLNQINKQKVILVTSGINMRRASLTFEQLGIPVLAQPSDFYGINNDANAGVKRKFGVEDFLPNVEALVISTRVFEEYLGMIYYFLRGWVSPTVS